MKGIVYVEPEMLDPLMRERFAIITASGCTMEEMYRDLRDWGRWGKQEPAWVFTMARAESLDPGLNQFFYSVGMAWLAHEALFVMGNVAILAEALADDAGRTKKNAGSRASAATLVRDELAQRLVQVLQNRPDYTEG